MQLSPLPAVLEDLVLQYASPSLACYTNWRRKNFQNHTPLSERTHILLLLIRERHTEATLELLSSSEFPLLGEALELSVSTDNHILVEEILRRGCTDYEAGLLQAAASGNLRWVQYFMALGARNYTMACATAKTFKHRPLIEHLAPWCPRGEPSYTIEGKFSMVYEGSTYTHQGEEYPLDALPFPPDTKDSLLLLLQSYYRLCLSDERGFDGEISLNDLFLSTIPNVTEDDEVLERALRCAISNGRDSLVLYLLEKGAEILPEFLPFIVWSEHISTLRWLIATGRIGHLLSPDVIKSIAERAVEEGSVTALDLLRDHKTDLQQLQRKAVSDDNDGETNPYILRYLLTLEAPSDINELLRMATQTGFGECVKVLVVAGADDFDGALQALSEHPSGVVGRDREMKEFLVAQKHRAKFGDKKKD